MYTPVPVGYYESDHWRRKRAETLRHYNYTCQRCGAKNGRLDVHHTPEAYQYLWREPLQLLQPLCHRKCHTKGRISLFTIRSDRTAYVWVNALIWASDAILRLCLLPFRLARRLLQRMHEGR